MYNDTIDNKKNSKLIFSPQLANHLLKKGYNIIKLKPKRNTENESVFVFHVEPGFYNDLEEWMEYAKEK